MNGIVDWAAGRARMVMAFILLSLVVGGYAYSTLPKEGEPDIEIPALFVSVQPCWSNRWKRNCPIWTG